MAKKIYKSLTGIGYTFPVDVSDVRTWVEIQPKFETSDTGVQGAIEAHSYFTSKQIGLSGNLSDQLLATNAQVEIGGAIATHSINAAGADYLAEDVITFASAGDDAAIKVLTVDEDGAVLTYEIIDAGTELTAGNKAQDDTTSVAGTGFILAITVTGEELSPKHDVDGDVFKTVEFPEVTGIQEAVAILRAAPYNVNHQALRNPSAIMSQAVAHSVSFPNWIV
jgi:hypothetical protein